MKKLKVEEFGTHAQGIRLKGDPRNPEPEHVRIVFPGGDVDVVRCDDGAYWVHIRRNRPDDCVAGSAEEGVLRDGRMDLTSKGVHQTDQGDIRHPDLYHVAIRVMRK